MQRPHAVRMNLDLFYDYRTNVPLYPEWQAFLRAAQPKTIMFWAKQDCRQGRILVDSSARSLSPLTPRAPVLVVLVTRTSSRSLSIAVT